MNSAVVTLGRRLGIWKLISGWVTAVVSGDFVIGKCVLNNNAWFN